MIAIRNINYKIKKKGMKLLLSRILKGLGILSLLFAGVVFVMVIFGGPRDIAIKIVLTVLIFNILFAVIDIVLLPNYE